MKKGKPKKVILKAQGKTAAKKYPIKRSINFIDNEKVGKERKKSASYAVITIIGVVVLVLGAITVPYYLLSQKEAQLSAAENRVLDLETSLIKYPDIVKEYNMYTTVWMSDIEKNLFDVQDAIAIIQDEILKVTSISKYEYKENIISTELVGITLENTSVLVRTLEARKEVTRVQIFNANKATEVGKQPTVALEIALKIPVAGAEDVVPTPEVPGAATPGATTTPGAATTQGGGN